MPDFCIAVENIAFGTGNPSSASWLFVDELSMDWQNVNLGNNTTLTTRYFESDAEKFKALQFRRLRFVIAPLNSISIKELKQRHLRIVSTLWNVYLAPMVITGTDSLRALNDYHNWYVPKGSRIMPLAFADEIIVVDMESEDKTVKLALKYTKNVFNHKNVGYVEPARNFAIQKATGNWIFIVDADERVPRSLAVKLIKIANFYIFPPTKFSFKGAKVTNQCFKEG